MSEVKTIVRRTDEEILACLGYKQEFKRAFSPLEVFGLVVLVYALPNGGPVALVWGWGVCSIFLVIITLALAELGSAAPTSGGLYYWTFKFASPRWRRLLSWIVGCKSLDSNTIGLIAGVASVDWGCAVQLMAAVSIGSNTTFVPTTSQTFGVYAAILFCHAMVASLATSVVARLQTVYVVLNHCAVTPDEFVNTARYAFGGFENLSGWPNEFAFVLTGFDSSLHISEEASNASVAVPWALIGATVVGSVLGWGDDQCAISFRMGTDIEGIMASPIGQPMAAILFNSFGQRGTLAVWAIVVAVHSRQTFVFARDGGLPFSGYLYRINRHTTTPVNCAWFSAFISLLLGLLSFAGEEAISAIFSLGVVGLYIAYILPITARFMGGKQWVPGPFTLGRLVRAIGHLAPHKLTRILGSSGFHDCCRMDDLLDCHSGLPLFTRPTGADMNYTIVVLGVWIALCLVYYYLPVYGGVYWFRGPIANIGEDIDDDKVHGDKGSIEDEKKSLD
ncbi:amino acid permease-domain-containing protein [Amylocystis lapponica]|nr:amino acid permease-domain-containing protein [Amylocystis lapponica]